MKKVLNIFLKYILAFIIIICVYMILMTLSSLIPSSIMKENVKQSSETLLEDNEKKSYNLGYKTEEIFTFTDALMINTAYSIDSSSPIKSFILARKNYIPYQTKIEYVDSQYNLGASANYINTKTGDIYQTKELYGLMHDENIEESFEYARYWHGYLVILRPLLAIFNYNSIRIILSLITLSLIICMLVLIYKKINLVTAFIYALGLLSISIFIVSQSINEILIFIVAFIFTIILLLKKDKIKDIFMFFFIVGSVANFIDLLTAPIVTLGIVGTTYFLLLQNKNEKNSIKTYIIEILKICVAWGLGYGLTWISKWVITEVLFNRNLITQAIEQAIFRMKLPTKTDGTLKYDLMFVLQRNINFLSNSVISINIFMIIALIVYNIIKVMKKEIDFKNNLKECIPYFFMFILPFLWYMVLKQHSAVHAFFTYRILIISIINIFIIVTKIFKVKEN